MFGGIESPAARGRCGLQLVLGSCPSNRRKVVENYPVVLLLIGGISLVMLCARVKLMSIDENDQDHPRVSLASALNLPNLTRRFKSRLSPSELS